MKRFLISVKLKIAVTAETPEKATDDLMKFIESAIKEKAKVHPKMGKKTITVPYAKITKIENATITKDC